MLVMSQPASHCYYKSSMCTNSSDPPSRPLKQALLQSQLEKGRHRIPKTYLKSHGGFLVEWGSLLPQPIQLAP